jgi:hypothetical protein
LHCEMTALFGITQKFLLKKIPSILHFTPV